MFIKCEGVSFLMDIQKLLAELTVEEKERLVKILFMQESLNDNQYHKLLEQGGTQ